MFFAFTSMTIYEGAGDILEYFRKMGASVHASETRRPADEIFLGQSYKVHRNGKPVRVNGTTIDRFQIVGLYVPRTFKAHAPCFSAERACGFSDTLKNPGHAPDFSPRVLDAIVTDARQDRGAIWLSHKKFLEMLADQSRYE
jgi:hypothetical protein